MAITGSIQEKSGRYYMVINMPMENGKTKPVWKATGLPVKGNKRQAQKMLYDRLAELNKSAVPYCKITVAEYFKSWLPLIKNEVRPNTYRSYYGNMTNHIIPYFEQKKILLQELKPYQLEAYYSSITGLTGTTIKHHHQNISKALSDAVRKGIIQYNPASAAKTPKAEKYHGKALTPDEINRMLVLFKSQPVELPVTLCAVYGFRRSEVLGLKWQNISFEKKTITIAETLQQNTGGNYTDKPKTESSYRTLPMTDSVFELLDKQKGLQETRKALMGSHYFQSDYICTWPDGKIISPNYLTRTFHTIISQSDLPMIRLHDLRHSVATNLLQRNMPLPDVQEWLGHSNASTTLDIYAHAVDKSKHDIAALLQQTLKLNG